MGKAPNSKRPTSREYPKFKLQSPWFGGQTTLTWFDLVWACFEKTESKNESFG
jgi:hypothetical protein